MTERMSGIVDRVFYSSASFSTGVLKGEDGDRIRFRGSFCVREGDIVTIEGKWKVDPKYGEQFFAESVSYDLPDTPEGLIQYLAKHPAFTGIGETTARKIVGYVASAEHLDRVIRQDIQELHRALRIPRKTLDSLREAWIANSADNEVRSYLAGFGLTHHQMETLLETFGSSVVGVLRADPYQLIRHIKNYGFKRVDKIALAMKTPKDNPSRIEAALLYLVSEEVSSGHTWIAGAELLDKANGLLLLDTLDGREIIQAACQRLLAEGLLVADGNAVTTPQYLEAERFIQSCFEEHSSDPRPIEVDPQCLDGLKRSQRTAFETALEYAIVVISGGAGTGKTHTLARIASAFKEEGLAIALCSPTGKAAKRIEESLRAQGLNLEAKTIHRLLEYNGRQFQRESLSHPPEKAKNDGVPSEPGYDVVLLDEFSMVDVPLMAALLRRIDFNHTRLILVGDHNQLPPVGPGNVLRDCIEHQLVPTVILDEVVRQAGILKTNCTAILSERIAPTAVNDPAWTVIDSFQDPLQIQVYLRDLLLERIPERLNLDPIDDVQIITPTHLGPLGTKAINQMMQRLLHGDVSRKFAVGDKVIQTANDYELGVMNGTIGRVVAVEPSPNTGYIVEFDGPGQRFITDTQTQCVQLAYALTAHKAQGSEFPCVVVLCHKSHYFADRNWLYTAVTRASRHCILIGDRWGLRNTVKKNNTTKRRTFLGMWAKSQTEMVEAYS